MKLRREAVELLGLIVAEWKSDPMSVQCFDLRLVEKATKLVDRHAKVDIWAHDPLSHRFTVSILPLQSLHKVIK